MSENKDMSVEFPMGQMAIYRLSQETTELLQDFVTIGIEGITANTDRKENPKKIHRAYKISVIPIDEIMKIAVMNKIIFNRKLKKHFIEKIVDKVLIPDLNNIVMKYL
jgi:hypothetical protein